MNAHLFSKTISKKMTKKVINKAIKKTKISAALVLASQLGFAHAVEPVFLNNAIHQDELIPYARHDSAGDATPVGDASKAAAYQQAMVIDSKNTVYSAYMDKVDGRAYVLKLVNNRWVAAASTDVDTDALTIGEVSTTELLAKDQSDTLVNKNTSMALAISANDEPHLAYVASDGSIKVHKLILDEDGNGTSWQALPAITTIGKPQYLRFELTAEGTPYILYGIANTKFADLTLVKLVEGVWVVQGDRPVTKVKVKTNFVEAGFDLSPTGTPYLAFDNDTFGLDIDKIYVQKLEKVGENLIWTTVGSRKLTTNEGVGNVRSVEMTVAPDGVPYLLTGSHLEHLYLSVTKFTGADNENDDWEFIGKAINFPFQTAETKSIMPDTKIKIDSKGTPYVIYQDINSSPRRVRVLRLEELLVDNELTNVWQEMNITLESLTSTGKTTNLPHRYNDVLFDSNDRPYVIYQDVGGNSKSRVLRAGVENNTEAMTFSVLEGFRDAGKFDVEIPGEGNVFDDVTLTLSGRDKDAFDLTELQQGKLKLTSDADFETPSYSFNVKATNELDESTEEIPVKVFFQPSTDLDVIAARPFSYSVFNCETPCIVDANEGEEIFFEAIKSKIDHFELSGDLPEGISFNLELGDGTETPEGEEPVKEGFSGIVSFNADIIFDDSLPTAYPITITAIPVEGALDGNKLPAQPTSIELVINVNNVAMDIDVADYDGTLPENTEYSNAPTSAIAFSHFSFEGVPSWLQEDGLTGELTGTPNYTEAGTYDGKVTAHGFDDELVEYPFSIVVEQVDLALDDLPEQEPLTHDENEAFSFIPAATAAHHFTIANKPEWAVFDDNFGDVTGKPSFTDEGEYSFTITAYGYDDEKPLSTTLSVTVEHVNAPPTIEFIPSIETIAGEPVTIDVMSYVSDVDSEEYGDKVSFKIESGRYQCDGLGEFEQGDDPSIITCDGFGVLEQVANGFIYTPSLEDKDQVTITFQVTDDNSDDVSDDSDDSGPAVSTGTFGINVKFLENKSFEQSSSAGSFGGSLLALFSMLFGMRSFKRKA